MRALVRQEMEAGALGIGSSLIYAPAFYATTEELIELCKVAAQYGGKYISHMRSEGEPARSKAVDELIRIAREAGIPAEIYHLKAAGERNWAKMDAVIARIEAARREGLTITADMYTYPAGSTGLDAAMPPWALDGGYDALLKRLRDPATRKKHRARDRARRATTGRTSISPPARPTGCCSSSSGTRRSSTLTGKTLAEVGRASRKRNRSRRSWISSSRISRRVGTVYFMMSEENIRKQIAAAVGLVRIRRGVDGPRGSVPEVGHASSRLRQLRPAARQVRPRREGHRRCRRRSGG